MRHGKLGMALVGPGFIAKHHLDAVRRLGDVEIIGIAGSSAASAERKAKELCAGRAFRDYEELVRNSEVDVVHNTTPSHLHFEITMGAILAGKHVVSDKPLALTPEQCAKLRDAAEESGVVNAVTFNYRGNPLVQQARAMVANDELGPLVYIHGQYLQDWTTDAAVYSWRMDPEKAGPSAALADIGSHWIDLAEHVCARRITHVLADIATVVSTRFSSGHSAEAFGSTDNEGERKPVRIAAEDLASVLLRFEDGVRGNLKVGQALPGHKNDLQLEVNGRTSSLLWKQEEQNELWIGHHDRANSILCKQPSLLAPGAASYAHLPAGHQESWADAFRNVIADIYSVIRGDKQTPATLCTFADAYRTSCVVESMLESHARGGVWTAIGDPFPRTGRSNSTTGGERFERLPERAPTA